MKHVVLLACLALALLSLSPLSGIAQTAPPQTPLSPEAAQIEQLFKEIRELTGKGKHDEARSKAEEAAALSQKSGDQRRWSRALFQVASADHHAGRIEKAIENFKQASILAGQAGDLKWQSMSLNTAAMLLTNAGLSEEGLYFYHQSLSLWRQQKDYWNEAFVLQQMVPLYLNNGNVAQAELNLQEALRLVKDYKAGGKEDMGLENLILLQFAAIELARGNRNQAIIISENYMAKETLRTKGYDKIEIRLNLGTLYIVAQEYEKALVISEELLAIVRQYKIPHIEAMALGHIAWAKFNLGKAAEALPLIKQSIALFRHSGSSRDQGLFLSYHAEIQAALGQSEEALENYRRTINTIEHERVTMIPTEMAKASLVALRHSMFTRTIDFMVTQNRADEALEIAERYHARAFLDVLAESRIDLRKELTPSQKKQENDLFTRITKIQKELWQPSLPATSAEQLRKDLHAAENDLTIFQVEMRRANPRYASVKYPQPLKPAAIAEELLNAETALIEFVLSEKKSFAWVIRPGKTTAVTLPPRKEITDLISQYRAALEEKVSSLNAGQSATKLNAIGQQLYQQLLKPLEPSLTSIRKLIVVSDGPLVYLPFETLVCDSVAKRPQYLLERFAISYAPSASALAALKSTTPEANRATKGVIAFGDPIYTEERTKSALPDLALNATRNFDLRNLPYTRREVTAIAALFPTAEQQTFLGAEAREQSVKTAALDKFRYIHFAAHGILDENYPARSGIVLSHDKNSKDDGVLQMSEVMRLKLNAEMVTLSACRTGLGKLLNGEGMIGLTRAFFYAGAESVTVSLWNVNDIATAALMKSFYQNLQKGMRKDEALRQAKITMLKGPQRAWQHPYFWAPFILVGDSQ